MTDDDNFGLSRRKVLGSIGTIGVAAGGIGASTWAGYTDDEIKELNTHAGSLDLRISETGTGNWRNGPVSVKIGQIAPGDTVGHCEWLKNVGQTDGACLSMKITNVHSDEGQSEYNNANVYNPDAETDTKHSNGGELDDQIEVGGTLKDENGNVLGDIPTVPFSHLKQGMATVLGDDVLLKKNGGNKVQVCLDFHFPHRQDNNEAMKDTLTFDLKFTLHQKCPGISRGSGFAKVEEGYSTGSGGDKTGFARARHGDAMSSGDWELAVGKSVGNSAQAQYDWDFGQNPKVPFKYVYDGSGTATLYVDGKQVGGHPVDSPTGRIALQGKADEGTVEVIDASLLVNKTHLYSNLDVTATNDGSGRAIRYLSIDPDGNLSNGFKVSGHLRLSKQGDYSGSSEGLAFDIVVE